MNPGDLPPPDPAIQPPVDPAAAAIAAAALAQAQADAAAAAQAQAQADAAAAAQQQQAAAAQLAAVQQQVQQAAAALQLLQQQAAAMQAAAVQAQAAAAAQGPGGGQGAGAGAPGGVLPQNQFALTPALLNAGFLNFAIQSDVKLYYKAIAPLTNKFDLQPANMRGFIQAMTDKASDVNWVTTLTIAIGNVQYTISSNNTDRSLLKT